VFPEIPLADIDALIPAEEEKFRTKEEIKKETRTVYEAVSD